MLDVSQVWCQVNFKRASLRHIKMFACMFCNCGIKLEPNQSDYHLPDSIRDQNKWMHMRGRFTMVYRSCWRQTTLLDNNMRKQPMQDVLFGMPNCDLSDDCCCVLSVGVGCTGCTIRSREPCTIHMNTYKPTRARRP